MRLRSGTQTRSNSNLRSGTQKRSNSNLPQLPPEILYGIFKFAGETGPSQPRKMALVSQLAKNATKNSRATEALKRAMWKHVTDPRTIYNYSNNKNIPNHIGRFAHRTAPNRSVLGRLYRFRENTKKNFRNRILPRGPMEVNNNGMQEYENNRNNRITYELYPDRTLYKIFAPPGRARATRFIGKLDR